MFRFILGLRVTLRAMLKRPSFLIAAVLLLALGTGINAALFGILHSVVFQPLAAKQPEQLITLSAKASPGVSIPDLQDFRAQSNSLQQIESYIYSTFTFRDRAGTELITGAEVTLGYLAMLGNQPLQGRTFTAEPERGEDHSAVLSEGFWKSRFAGDPSVLGTIINLNGQSYTIVGVMPQSVRLPFDNTQVWIPVPDNSPWKNNRGIHAMRLLARMKPDTSVQSVQADLTLLTERLAQLYPKEDGGRSVIVIGLHDALVSNIRPKLYLLELAVILIFLIASSNVASLSLTRSNQRMRESAIRKALGATRAQFVHQLLIENSVLAILGSAIGWVLALWLVNLVIALQPAGLPRLHEIALDYHVLLLLILYTVIIVVVLTLGNMWEFERLNPNEVLGAQGLGVIGRHRRRLHNTLIGVEVAMAVTLLIGAGLLIRSFQKLGQIDIGFSPRNRLVMQISVPAGLRATHSATDICQPIYENLRSLPGVSSVGFANVLPLQGSFDTEYFVNDRTGFDSHNSGEARIVNEDYFQAAGINLITGRQFTSEDNATAPHVVIINQRMAKEWFQNEDPVGHRIRAFGSKEWMSIVGVVADVHDGTVDSEPSVEFFLPYRQNPYTPAMWNIGWVVKTSTGPSRMMTAVKHTVQSTNPEVVLSGLKPMSEIISDSLRDRGLAMRLLAMFAGLALILAAYGIYALLTYSVRQRTREIGLRMAMGANRQNVLVHITFEGMRVVILGLLAGTISAYILSRVLNSLLFGVKATDPLTFVTANIVLLTISLCAVILPAWRGAQLDPLVALRSE